MRVRSALLATVYATLAPLAAGAQLLTPRAPVPFTGPTRTYAVSGCGNGALSVALDAPLVRIFCLEGVATIGVATAPSSGQPFFQAVLDLVGTRVNGFDGRFFDLEDSNTQFDLAYANAVGRPVQRRELFGPAADPTGRTTFGYTLFLSVDQPGLPGVPPESLRLGPSGQAQFGYVPADAPRPSPFEFGRGLVFALTVTETPEPSTLALAAAGGLAVWGVARRRRA